MALFSEMRASGDVGGYRGGCVEVLDLTERGSRVLQAVLRGGGECAVWGDMRWVWEGGSTCC